VWKTFLWLQEFWQDITCRKFVLDILNCQRAQKNLKMRGARKLYNKTRQKVNAKSCEQAENPFF